MYYYLDIIQRRGHFGIVWLAAFDRAEFRKRSTAAMIRSYDVEKCCDEILRYAAEGRENCPKMNLYVTSVLLSGLNKVFKAKVEFTFDDCARVFVKWGEVARLKAILDHKDMQRFKRLQVLLDTSTNLDRVIPICMNQQTGEERRKRKNRRRTEAEYELPPLTHEQLAALLREADGIRVRHPSEITMEEIQAQPVAIPQEEETFGGFESFLPELQRILNGEDLPLDNAEPVPDAPIPVAPDPDAPVPVAPVPDAPVPVAPVSDAPVPVAPVPDVLVPVSPVPDAPVPVAPVPDVLVPVSPVPDEPVPVAPVPDAPVPVAENGEATSTGLPDQDAPMETEEIPQEMIEAPLHVEENIPERAPEQPPRNAPGALLQQQLRRLWKKDGETIMPRNPICRVNMHTLISLRDRIWEEKADKEPESVSHLSHLLKHFPDPVGPTPDIPDLCQAMRPHMQFQEPERERRAVEPVRFISEGHPSSQGIAIGSPTPGGEMRVQSGAPSLSPFQQGPDELMPIAEMDTGEVFVQSETRPLEDLSKTLEEGVAAKRRRVEKETSPTSLADSQSSSSRVEANLLSLVSEAAAQNETVTFAMVAPPASTSKLNAACLFTTLLDLEWKQMIKTQQNEPYGDIIIHLQEASFDQ